MRNSDPYQSYSYDTLHVDDTGKFGNHLWPLVLKVLKDSGMSGNLAVK